MYVTHTRQGIVLRQKRNSDMMAAMIFSRKNAGKWVASKKGRVVDTARKLETLLRRIEKRPDRKEIRFDKAPPTSLLAG